MISISKEEIRSKMFFINEEDSDQPIAVIKVADLLEKEVKGEWIKMADDYGHSSYFCTKCGTQKGKAEKICPNCGASMRGEE